MTGSSVVRTFRGMYQEDYLLRQIKQLVEAVAGLEEDEAAEHADLDDALRRTLGLGVELLDRLPPEAIRSLVRKGDTHDEQRLELVVRTLEALGRGESAVHAARRNKAAALSGA